MSDENQKAESNQKTGAQKQHDDEQGGGHGGGQSKHAAGETTPPDRTGNRTGSRADDGSERESN